MGGREGLRVIATLIGSGFLVSSAFRLRVVRRVSLTPSEPTALVRKTPRKGATEGWVSGPQPEFAGRLPWSGVFLGSSRRRADARHCTQSENAPEVRELLHREGHVATHGRSAVG